MFIIGIDVGGTNTDAVLVRIESHEIVDSIKTPTTKDIHSGICNALAALMNQSSSSQILSEDISAVIIGTTTFLNAVLEESDELAKVNVIRLCGPSSREYPPFTDFPESLEAKIKGQIFMVNGGYQFDKTEISSLDEQEIRKVGETLIEHKTEDNFLNIVVSGVFSILDQVQETQCANILSSMFKEAKINYSFTLSSITGSLGLLEREAASILNASLRPLAYKTIGSFEKSLEKYKIPPHKLFLTKNDGTITSLQYARNFPIFTFNSGPTNSLRGAYLLTKKIQTALVADIGGTSTDITFLKNGYPRPSSAYVRVGGVRTNFRMPDTYCIGLGGGSLVTFDEKEEKLSVGPKSVGYNLKELSMVFGGKSLTATDIAVCAGLVDLGTSKDLKRMDLSEAKIDLALKEIVRKLENALDHMKTTKEAIPLILVGGGSVLIPKNVKLEGISEVIRPDHFDVANALGAANAQISANIESIISLDKEPREVALERLKKDLIKKAINNGAKEGTIEITHDEIPLSYIPGKAIQVYMNAIGDLDFSTLGKTILEHSSEEFISLQNNYSFGEVKKNEQHYVKPIAELNSQVIESTNRQFEEIDGVSQWVLNNTDIDFICCGAGILGTGGGGSPYLGNLLLKKFLKSGKKVRVFKFEDMKEQDLVSWVAFYGSPLVQIEKLPGSLCVRYALEDMINIHYKLTNQKLSALMAAEIGGLNSIIPLLLASELGVPVLDGDFMGRAFPELQLITPFMYKAKDPFPITLADDSHNSLMLTHIQDKCAKNAENFFRHIIMKMGCFAGIASNGFTKKELEKLLVRGSLTRAWELGKLIFEARHNKSDFVEKLEQSGLGKRLFEGKIIDVTRSLDKGYTNGVAVIMGINQYNNKKMMIDFQNENLRAVEIEKDSGNTVIKAIVPDLITVIDIENFEAVMTEEYKYGLRVTCIKIPCDPLLATKEALEFCGPKAFGFK